MVRMWRNMVCRRIGDGNVRKFQKFPNSRWRTDAILKIIFGYNSAPYCPIKTKFGVRRLNLTHTKVWWWKCQISKIQHGGRPPFFKIVITPYLSRESSEFDKIWYADANIEQGDGIVTKIQKFLNSRWRTDAILKIIVGYNSAPYCPTKTKFGMRRRNRTHTKVRWWKCQISKIQHGRRPPFWKSLYLNISTANRPNFTKFSLQT